MFEPPPHIDDTYMQHTFSFRELLMMSNGFLESPLQQLQKSLVSTSLRMCKVVEPVCLRNCMHSSHFKVKISHIGA